MLTEIDLNGIYVAPFSLHLLLAAVVFFVLRWLLLRSGLLPRLWYLALAEVSLFVIVMVFILPLVLS